MKSILLILSILLTLLTACGEVEPEIVTVIKTEKTDYAIVAGAIKFNNDTVTFINDEHHAPMNTSDAYIENDYVVIKFAFEAEKVITFMCTPDETYVKNNVSCGCSVGLDEALCYFSKDGIPVRPNEIEIPFSNVFFYGMFL